MYRGQVEMEGKENESAEKIIRRGRTDGRGKGYMMMILVRDDNDSDGNDGGGDGGASDRRASREENPAAPFMAAAWSVPRRVCEFRREAARETRILTGYQGSGGSLSHKPPPPSPHLALHVHRYTQTPPDKASGCIFTSGMIVEHNLIT